MHIDTYLVFKESQEVPLLGKKIRYVRQSRQSAGNSHLKANK